MITTSDAALAGRIRVLRSHGGVRDGAWYRYEEAGFNYRLSDVNGAIGVAQMGKLAWILERKRGLAARLGQLLSGVPGVAPPRDPEWGGHIYQSYVVTLDAGIDRSAVIAGMRSQGVETTLGTYALHDQPFYQREYGYASGDLPRSHECFLRTLTVPLYPQMTDADLETITATLRVSIEGAARGAGRA